jgi:NADPH-dependent curcumin reductase CurA
MYFENVGGIHLEAAMDLLRSGGRVAVCGQISNYNLPAPELSKINLMKMIYSQQRIEEGQFPAVHGCLALCGQAHCTGDGL